MSQSLSLVEYQADENGNLYEEDCHVIESAFITPEVISSIEQQLENKPLLEETGTTASSMMKCLENSSLDKVLSILEMEFIKFITSESANNAKSLVIRDEISSLINDFRTITNLYHVIKLKKEKFENYPNVVLKLG
jgi:lysyl-tRNA synthetase class I